MAYVSFGTFVDNSITNPLSAAWANAVDQAVSTSYTGWTPGTNQAYGPGYNVLLRIGPLRVLHFSIVNNFDVEVGSGFYQVPYADRPAGNVPGAGTLIVSGAPQMAAYTLQTDQSVVLAAGVGGTGNIHQGTIVWTVF